MDAVGDGVGGRSAVGRVELDAEVAVDAARIVAGRQQDAALGANLCVDHIRHI